MINGKIQNFSLWWFDEPSTCYQHDFWLFQLSTAIFASWANRINSELAVTFFSLLWSTFVRLGTSPQWCIKPQLRGHSYICFSSYLSHLLFLFCHIHIYCNFCLSISANPGQQSLFLVSTFIPQPVSYPILKLWAQETLIHLFSGLTAFSETPPSTFSSLWDWGWKWWDPAWYRSARTSTSGESGSVEWRIYLPSSELWFSRACAKYDYCFSEVCSLMAFNLRNQGYYTCPEEQVKLNNEISEILEFFREETVLIFS